ncbi:hypothetical protein [Carboxylicivirga caseinilyticus]|uniref:hypothetical protein n=1 Tax=Carboxylicivirga caseinilyticus TaxID=3417572 RepID=UPI003D34170D|nr:hypothetical protein [Marinilabiliaceae bacterium A049]
MKKNSILKMSKSISLLGLSFILFITILTSCDPAIGYEYNLDNKSDKELKVYYKGLGFNDTTSSMTVLPRTEIQLYEIEVWGSNPHDEKDNFLLMFDTLSITATDSSKLLSDYLKSENWSYRNDIGHLGFVKTGTNIYNLEISNEDFESQ